MAFIHNTRSVFAPSTDTCPPKVTTADICPPYLWQHKLGSSICDNFSGEGAGVGGKCRIIDGVSAYACAEISCHQWQLDGGA